MTGRTTLSGAPATSDVQAGGFTAADNADVDPRASVGDRTLVWQLATIREWTVVGEDCVIGRGVYLGPGARLGDRCKIQNYALVYEPAVLEDGVFIGPAAVLTNDLHPRAVEPDGRPQTADDWEPLPVVVRRGASVGARAVCVGPVTIGRWAMVAAGAVVTRDVPDHALVVGVPARQIGWVGEAGVRLTEAGPGRYSCPSTGRTYIETEGGLAPEGER